jgi:hypothetical protein
MRACEQTQLKYLAKSITSYLDALPIIEAVIKSWLAQGPSEIRRLTDNMTRNLGIYSARHLRGGHAT